MDLSAAVDRILAPLAEDIELAYSAWESCPTLETDPPVPTSYYEGSES